MESVYPRGARLMKRLFCQFDHCDAFRWFEQEGVELVVQEDQCVFPRSQDAMEIVDTLLSRMRSLGVETMVGCRVEHVTHEGEGYRLSIRGRNDVVADVVVVTTGGQSKTEGLSAMLDGLGLEAVPSVPSLFSLCLPAHPITKLMGIVVDEATVSIAGTRMKANGPLLVTHWGLSGPAILKLSSYAARLLHEKGYKCTLVINWLGNANEQTARMKLDALSVAHPHKLVQTTCLPQLGGRLWAFLLQSGGIPADTRWSGMTRKQTNRLAALLTSQNLAVDGKNRFKEEFVTCGGVALGNVNANTLECRLHPGLYFAGEVLDVDAITGGFNLQAAWTMGYVVGRSIKD